MLIPVAAAGEVKRVLIIHSFGRDFAPFNAIGLVIRTDLTLLLRQPVVFHDVSLDAERGGTAEDERPFVEYLLRRSGAPPDLVIANGTPAMRFYLRHRDALFPERPLLVSGIDHRMLDGIRLRAKDRVVSVDLDISAVARTILQLRPQTTTIAHVLGASPLEQFWAGEVQREFAQFSDELRLLPPDGLSLDEMRRRVAALPPDSAVFYQMFAVGADGVQHENEQALASIRESSSSPVFGLFANQLGKGIVGGSLFDLRQVGSVTAELAANMLEVNRGSDANRHVEKQAPAFDWRELQRWGIPESRLPPGAEVRFRPPSLWDQHKVPVLVGVAIVLFQGALIAALLFQRARRQSAEEEAAGLSGRLITAHEDERRRLARELHDDLTQRLARLAIDAGRMERASDAPAGVRPLREDLVRLSEDVHALSYRLHPSVLDDLGLVEALRAECDRVGRHGEMRVEVNTRDTPDAVPSEASLCLFRVAQEALSNAARHGRASAATVLLSPRDRGLQLAVSDNGTGFDPAQSRARASLGLASMRERVRLLSGHLDIESTPGRGTTVVAWVPA
ncbi:sensor histidine kinase [Variovorax sp. J22P240]|uniref:sensor histidine kinase n=1 Tax=Variovorax sp. J22P240 TaxID=3053514 RepID=UPI002578E64D|nr:sensor histidine kinase [Variovorax sp. J22P240]MDM0000762.1 sensor histidine kinase [Variovorax sp. J22P240]